MSSKVQNSLMFKFTNGFFLCTQCPFGTNKKKGILQHSVHHQVRFVYRCPCCNFSSNFMETTSKHNTFTHGNDLPSKKVLYQCCQCMMQFKTMYLLKAHCLECHSSSTVNFGDLEKGVLGTNEIELDGNNSSVSPIKLDYGLDFEKSVDQTRVIDEKEMNPSNEKENTCERLKQFSNKKSDNEITFQNGTFYCKYCPYISRNKSALILHLCHHQERKTFRCPHCSFSSDTMGSIANHCRDLHNLQNWKNSVIFQCSYCSINCKSLKRFDLHLKSHQTAEEMSNPILEKATIQQRVLMMNNVKNKFGLKSKLMDLECPNCSYQSSTKMDLFHHERKFHPNHVKRDKKTGQPLKSLQFKKFRSLQCPYCETKCFTRFDIRNHFDAHTEVGSILDRIDLSNELKYQCQLCPAKYGRSSDFSRHFQKCHVEKGDVSESILEEQNFGKAELLKCPQCPAVRKCPAYLKQHMKWHLPKDKEVYSEITDIIKKMLLQCPHCTFRLKFPWQLRDHIKSHHEKEISNRSWEKVKYQCPYCPYTVRKRAKFRRHFEIHRAKGDFLKTNEEMELGDSELSKTPSSLPHHNIQLRPSKTTIALLDKKSDGSAGKHFNTTNNSVVAARFSCSKCSFYCAVKSAFENHQRLKHKVRKVKPQQKIEFKCPYCSFTSHLKKKVKLHVKASHDGFQCYQCQFKANDLVGLNSHLKKEHPAQANLKCCSLCSFKYAFKASKAYKQHMRKAHPVKLDIVPCPECPKKFPTEKSLDFHTKKYHIPHFKCPTCSFSSHLLEKVNFHISKYHKKCPYCPYLNVKPKTFLIHLMIHNVNLDKDSSMKKNGTIKSAATQFGADKKGGKDSHALKIGKKEENVDQIEEKRKNGSQTGSADQDEKTNPGVPIMKKEQEEVKVQNCISSKNKIFQSEHQAISVEVPENITDDSITESQNKGQIVKGLSNMTKLDSVSHLEFTKDTLPHMSPNQKWYDFELHQDSLMPSSKRKDFSISTDQEESELDCHDGNPIGTALSHMSIGARIEKNSIILTYPKEPEDEPVGPPFTSSNLSLEEKPGGISKEILNCIWCPKEEYTKNELTLHLMENHSLSLKEYLEMNSIV